jgi:hypothetical protein
MATTKRFLWLVSFACLSHRVIGAVSTRVRDLWRSNITDEKLLSQGAVEKELQHYEIDAAYGLGRLQYLLDLQPPCHVSMKQNQR